MKITLYTITDCQFSKQEKEYFTSHQLQFEEKNLETNKEFLTEMLVVSNNFAGTPVTKIEKDDGKIEVLKGFTKEEFDKVLGFETTAEPKRPEEKPQEPKAEAQKPAEEPKAEPPPTETPAPASGQAQAAQQPPVPTQPAQSAPTNETNQQQASDPLNSILNDLQAKSDNTNSPASPDSTSSTDSTSPTPAIPDFSSKT